MCTIVILIDYLPVNLAAKHLREMPEDNFFRYNSPFEQKWALKKEYHDTLKYEFSQLETLLQLAIDLFDRPLYHDTTGQYRGAFRYEPGDYLNVHLDAQIHPTTELRHHVTVLWYLAGSGNLEFWRDNPPQGLVNIVNVPSISGTVVMFDNTDNSWHGVPCAQSERLVLTVSFMSVAFTGITYKNRYAYFKPRPDEVWDADMYAMRNARADGKH